MMKKLILGAVVSTLVLTGATASLAAKSMPGEGVTLKPARATWNTGFFQEALIRKGLEELGYEVKKPKDLANPIAYKSIALGDIGYGYHFCICLISGTVFSPSMRNTQSNSMLCRHKQVFSRR